MSQSLFSVRWKKLVSIIWSMAKTDWGFLLNTHITSLLSMSTQCNNQQGFAFTLDSSHSSTEPFNWTAVLVPVWMGAELSYRVKYVLCCNAVVDSAASNFLCGGSIAEFTAQKLSLSCLNGDFVRWSPNRGGQPFYCLSWPSIVTDMWYLVLNFLGDH